MPSNIPPNAAPSHSANDNGPLTSGQVKVLKIAIAVMAVMIVAALLAIVARVIYLSAVKKQPEATPAAVTGSLVPKTTLALPAGAVVRNVSMHGNRLLVHYETPAGPAAAVLDLASGKTLSTVIIEVAR